MEEAKVYSSLADDQHSFKHATRKELTGRDISEIIKACYNNNVTKFIYRDLFIEFTAHHTDLVDSYQATSSKKPQETQFENDQEREKLEAELDQLKIEDPVAYEKYVTEEH